MTNYKIVLHAITVFPHVAKVTPLDNGGGNYCDHGPTQASINQLSMHEMSIC